MTKATFNLNKALTIIEEIEEYTCVFSTQLNKFEDLLKYDEITLVGLCKKTKIEKYSNILLNSGYRKEEIVRFNDADFENKEVFNFRIKFEKN